MTAAGDHAPSALRARHAQGTLLALLSAASFGLLPVVFQLATRGGFERHSLLAQRFLLAGVLLFTVLAVTGRARLPGRQLVTCLLMGFAGYAVQAWMFFTAVTLSGAGLATVLLYLYPGFVTLLAFAVHGERPSRARATALGLALLGCLCACALGPARPSLAGVAASLGGALLYAVYLTLSGVLLRDVKPLAAGAYVCFGAGTAFALLAVLAGSPTLADTPQRAGYVVALAVLCTLVPIVALFAALTRLGVVRVAVISTLEPAVTLVLAAFWLGESFGPAQLAGAALVVSSVVLIHREGA